MRKADQGKYIMIVEDAADERDAARLVLEIEGYDVVALASGEEALEYMRRGGDPPQMILLDLMMHGINGWDFRRAQLADPCLAAVPVVVCSGDNRLDEKAEALGVVDRLPKPIDQKALLELAAIHYGDRTSRREGPEHLH